MRTTKIIELATKYHRFTDYETDVVGYDSKGKSIKKQHKVWAFTEEQLKKFVRDIERVTKDTL